MLIIEGTKSGPIGESGIPTRNGKTPVESAAKALYGL